MKKLLVIFLIMICACVFIWTPTYAAASAATVSITHGEITGSNVAMRKEASANSAILCKIGKGESVQILRTNVNAQWDQVVYKGKTGYVNRVYVNWDSSLDEYNISYVAKVINVTKDVVVRSAPKTSAKSIGNANKGEILTVSQRNAAAGWQQVAFEGKTGYISSKYLDVYAKVDNTQLCSLSIKGGTLSQAFSPKEYGYVVTASTSKVMVTARANDGVTVDINGSGMSSLSIGIPSGSMKTVRISLNGQTKYTIYILRNVLTVGTFNIKRGYGNLPMQGRMINIEKPDIMGLQELIQDTAPGNIVDNLASLKTINMPNTNFAKTIDLSSTSKYGIGILSHYKISSVQTFTLDSGGYEKRILQKAVISIGGKKVSFYNTHFSFNSADIRTKEFEQVAQIMKKDKNKYKILVGDFNAKGPEFAQIPGYTLAHTEQTTYYDYFGNAFEGNIIDNIIVTKNITVVNSRIIQASLSDHDPLFAYLILK